MYLSAAAIQAKIPSPILDEILDDDGDGRRDDGLLDQVIANASQEVDAYLCHRLALPLASVPASVAAAALWFAIEELYGRRQRELPPQFAKSIQAARDWLAAIRDGKQQLDAANPIAAKANSGGHPNVPGRVPASGSGVTYES